MAEVTLDISKIIDIAVSLTNPGWGITAIKDELFVGEYLSSTSSSKVYVYDLKTLNLVRTMTSGTPYFRAFGTDGDHLILKTSVTNQYAICNKDTGAVIETKTLLYTGLTAETASFVVDLENDLIYYVNYSTGIYVARYSTGEIISSWTVTGCAFAGISVISSGENKYIFLSSYGSGGNKIVRSSDISSGFNGITFTDMYAFSSSIVGCVISGTKIYLTRYNKLLLESVDLIGAEFISYDTNITVAQFPSIDTSERYSIESVLISDSFSTSKDIKITESMNSEGVITGGTKTLFSKMLNKRSSKIEVKNHV